MIGSYTWGIRSTDPDGAVLCFNMTEHEAIRVAQGNPRMFKVMAVPVVMHAPQSQRFNRVHRSYVPDSAKPVGWRKLC